MLFRSVGWKSGDWICHVFGTLAYAGAAAPGCPDCEWAFDLSAPVEVVSEGDCAQFGGDAFLESYLEGYSDGSWGFTETYTNAAGRTYEDVLMRASPDAGWAPFAFNDADRSWVTTDGSTVHAIAPMTNDSVYTYYYYYRH